MYEFPINLFHGWTESKYGADHAFIIKDAGDLDVDNVGKILENMLEYDPAVESFDWEVTTLTIPKNIVEKIEDSAINRILADKPFVLDKQFIVRKLREWFDEMTEHDKNIRELLVDSAEDATFDFTGPRMRNLRKSKLNRELCREKIITTLELIGLYDGYNGSNYDTESLKQLIGTIEAMSDVKKEE